jgi:hypothetical protein
VLRFVKPMRCDNSGPNCVEVAVTPDGGRAVRDSKRPDGAMLTFTASEWDAFVTSAKTGQYDG